MGRGIFFSVAAAMLITTSSHAGGALTCAKISGEVGRTFFDSVVDASRVSKTIHFNEPAAAVRFTGVMPEHLIGPGGQVYIPASLAARPIGKVYPDEYHLVLPPGDRLMIASQQLGRGNRERLFGTSGPVRRTNFFKGLIRSMRGDRPTDRQIRTLVDRAIGGHDEPRTAFANASFDDLSALLSGRTEFGTAAETRGLVQRMRNFAGNNGAVWISTWKARYGQPTVGPPDGAYVLVQQGTSENFTLMSVHLTPGAGEPAF